MVYVLLKDGQTLPVPKAETAEVEEDLLVFRDPEGAIVMAMKASEASAFGKHESLAQYAESRR